MRYGMEKVIEENREFIRGRGLLYGWIMHKEGLSTVTNKIMARKIETNQTIRQ